LLRRGKFAVAGPACGAECSGRDARQVASLDSWCVGKRLKRIGVSFPPPNGLRPLFVCGQQQRGQGNFFQFVGSLPVLNQDALPAKPSCQRGDAFDLITDGFVGDGRAVNRQHVVNIRQNVIGAVSPQTGELFSLIFDGVDTDVFQFFLDRLAETLPKVEGVRQLLVLDNASWHKATRLNWHHFEPAYLPG